MAEKTIRTVKCPNCTKQVLWIKEQQYKPFCSERCQLIDLGDWAMEKQRIPGEPVHPSIENDENW